MWQINNLNEIKFATFKIKEVTKRSFGLFFILFFVCKNLFAFQMNAQSVKLGDTAGLENDYIKVYQNTAACTTVFTPGFGTRIIVALDKLIIKSS